MMPIADAIDRDAAQIRDDFLELPTLVLTVAQTARLHTLSTVRATTLLESLAAEGFLISGPHGVYRRSTPPTSD